jgi:hypothetical protein
MSFSMTRLQGALAVSLATIVLASTPLASASAAPLPDDSSSPAATTVLAEPAPAVSKIVTPASADRKESAPAQDAAQKTEWQPWCTSTFQCGRMKHIRAGIDAIMRGRCEPYGDKAAWKKGYWDPCSDLRKVWNFKSTDIWCRHSNFLGTPWWEKKYTSKGWHRVHNGDANKCTYYYNGHKEADTVATARTDVKVQAASYVMPARKVTARRHHARKVQDIRFRIAHAQSPNSRSARVIVTADAPRQARVGCQLESRRNGGKWRTRGYFSSTSGDHVRKFGDQGERITSRFRFRTTCADAVTLSPVFYVTRVGLNHWPANVNEPSQAGSRKTFIVNVEVNGNDTEREIITVTNSQLQMQSGRVRVLYPDWFPTSVLSEYDVRSDAKVDLAHPKKSDVFVVASTDDLSFKADLDVSRQ